MNEELANNLSKLLQTFNDKRVVSEGEVKQLMSAIVAILAANKKGVESLNADTKKQLQEVVSYVQNEHESVLRTLRGDLSKTRLELELATKDQNQRAFKRLQELIAKIRMPLDGKDGQDGRNGADGQPGKDGSPDTAPQIVDKLESLQGEARLDASAIKNLPQWIKQKGKDMLVGGIRFLENLADVSIVVTKKRQDLLVQYNTTNNRWQDGVALTVSTTAPTSPQVNDVWLDIS